SRPNSHKTNKATPKSLDTISYTEIVRADPVRVRLFYLRSHFSISDQLPPPRRHRRNDATLPPTMKPGRENAEVFALQHGLFAAQVTMRHEDPAAFQEMRSVILTDYRPATHIELMMAEEVAR